METDGLALIADGINAGEMVVIDGNAGLTDGIHVRTN
jgi:hypothetical protein